MRPITIAPRLWCPLRSPQLVVERRQTMLVQAGARELESGLRCHTHRCVIARVERSAQQLEAEFLKRVADERMGQLARQAPAPLVRAEDVIDFRVRSLGHDREAAVTDQLAGRLANDRVLPKPAPLVMCHRILDQPARLLEREGLQVTDEAHNVRVTGDSVQVLTVPGLESPQQQPCSLQYGSHEKAMSASAPSQTPVSGNARSLAGLTMM